MVVVARIRDLSCGANSAAKRFCIINLARGLVYSPSNSVDRGFLPLCLDHISRAPIHAVFPSPLMTNSERLMKCASVIFHIDLSPHKFIERIDLQIPTYPNIQRPGLRIHANACFPSVRIQVPSSSCSSGWQVGDRLFPAPKFRRTLLYRRTGHLPQSSRNQATFPSYLLTPSTPEDGFEIVSLS